MKNEIISLLVLLIVILLVASVGFFREASRQKRQLDYQRAACMELEERAFNLSNRNRDLEQRLNSLQDRLSQEQADCRAITDELNREISDLRDKLKGMSN